MKTPKPYVMINATVVVANGVSITDGLNRLVAEGHLTRSFADALLKDAEPEGFDGACSHGVYLEEWCSPGVYLCEQCLLGDSPC